MQNMLHRPHRHVVERIDAHVRVVAPAAAVAGAARIARRVVGGRAAGDERRRLHRADRVARRGGPTVAALARSLVPAVLKPIAAWPWPETMIDGIQ